MSRQASMRLGKDEVMEVPVYEMETYELTQEDHTLAIAFRLKARQARKHPHHVIVHSAQRRAVRLARSVETENERSPRSSSRGSNVGFGGFDSDTVVRSGDKAMSDHHSALDGNRDGVPCGEGGAPCSSQNEVPQLRVAGVRGSGWNISARFSRRSRSVGARVMPENGPSVMKSYSEGSYQGQRTSRVRSMLNVVMRRASHEKRIHTSGFDSLFLDPSSGAADRHSDSFDSATSEYVVEESMQHDEGETPVGRSQSSLRCILGNGASRFKAVRESGRAPAAAKA
eukprot:TRINITY_DN13225_c0_g4_i2.p1 TRINITY_DN13225_c0_g4~~TRINITY_DN13225_c0_g4_i2.p1  ORF type:complete len:284 (-),score=29.78 TRINITY_DN13225_c0_g4_i2:100-951(-)